MCNLGIFFFLLETIFENELMKTMNMFINVPNHKLSKYEERPRYFRSIADGT